MSARGRSKAALVAAACALLAGAVDAAGAPRVPVELSFTPPTVASQVSVAGSFNGWNATAHPLQRQPRSRTWRARLLLEPGRYEYKFVIDGKTWLPDPRARETSGEDRNSVLVVTRRRPGDPPARRGDGRIETGMLEHLAALPHRYRPAPDLLTLRLETDRGDVESATLVYADDAVHEVPMVRFAATEDGEHYQATIRPGRPAVAYVFRIRDGKGERYLAAPGVSTARPARGHFTADLAKVPLVVTPTWPARSVFYQIFPDRFANGDQANDQPRVEDWDKGKPGYFNYFGGDLPGVTQRLDYLRDLGVDALYFNPIFVAGSNHRYDTHDYEQVDPHLGGNDAFAALLAACKAAGMRVLLDGVFNHTGTGHRAFREASANGPSSPYWGWYHFKKFPVVQSPKPNYEAWWGFASLPKLNTDNPAVREHLLRVTRRWNKAGIDGWRLDVPNEVPHGFWREFRKVVKEDNPEAYIVGEIWSEGAAWLQGDQFDSVMNYVWRGAVLDFLAARRIGPAAFAARLARLRAGHPEPVTLSMFNLLGSHDTPRFLNLAKDRKTALRLAFLFQMTYPGVPVIYYGDEIGMRGGKDPDNRRPFPWESKKWDLDLRAYVQLLIRIRGEQPGLTSPDHEDLLTDDARRLYAYRRGRGTAAVLVALNDGGERRTVDLPAAAGLWQELLTGRRLVAMNGRLSIDVPRGGGVILAPASN